MKTNDGWNGILKALKTIIEDMPIDNFDSHEVIKRFAKKFEYQYVSLLRLYKKGAHRIVHAQIARSLVENMDYLKIEKNGKVMSETVFGFNNPNELWNKKKQK